MNDHEQEDQPQPNAARAKARDVVSRRNPARNAIDNLWTSAITIPLIMVSSILVARALGPSNRGELGFLYLFNGLVVPLALMGYPAAVTYFVSSRRYEVREVAASCQLVALLHGLFAAAVVMTLGYFRLLGKTASGTDFYLIVIMASVMPLQSTFILNTCILVGDSRFAIQNRLIMGRDVVLSSSMILVVWVLNLGLRGAVITTAALATTGFFFSTGGLWALYRPRLRLNRQFLRDSYLYSLRAWAGNLTNQANLRLDQLVLAYFCNAEALGWYAIAARLTQRLWMLPNALSVIVFNKVAGHKSAEESSELIDKVHRPLIWMMVALSVALAVVGWWLIPLVYGNAFQPAALAIILLLPGSVTVTSSRIVGRYFSGKGRPEINAIPSSLGAIASVIFYPLFIIGLSRSPLFGESLGGLIGAAVACSIVYSVDAFTKIWIYRRSIFPRKASLYMLRRSDVQWSLDQIRRGLGRGPAPKAAATTENDQPR